MRHKEIRAIMSVKRSSLCIGLRVVGILLRYRLE